MRSHTMVRSALLALGCAASVALLGARAVRAAYPGRNGAIGFIAATGGGTFQMLHGVWLISPSGGRPRRVHGMPNTEHFVFSPNGRQIAYVFQARVYVAPVAGGRPRRVAGGAETFKPAWSPNGRRIAFSYRGGIAVVGADGSGLRMICHRCDSDLAWSSTGRIAYVFNGSLYSIRPDGRGRGTLNLYRGEFRGDDHPNWAPDGRHIIFDQNGAGDVTNVYVAGADGSGLKQLTNFSNTDSDVPAYSPDGRFIVFKTDSDARLRIMNADGSGAHLLRIRGFDALTPDWRPVP